MEQHLSIHFIDTAKAGEIQSKIIELSGRFRGVRDIARLDSILENIINDDYYPTFESKLINLVFQINTSHCFNKGNKRISIALGSLFLLENGREQLFERFILEMEEIKVAVAAKAIDISLLSKIIWSILHEESHSEGLKIDIQKALAQMPVEEGQAKGITLYQKLALTFKTTTKLLTK